MFVSSKPTLGNVLIYRCNGTIGSSCDSLKSELSRFPHRTIEFADSEKLSRDDWELKTDLLVLPGGVCSKWELSLGDRGLQKIKNFVLADGGKIFGVCAGSYFLSQKSLYESGEVRIERERPYSIFPGIAKGPVKKKFTFEPTDESDSSRRFETPASSCSDMAFAIELETSEEMRGACYYQGGPVIGTKSPEIQREVIATFAGDYSGEAITGFLPSESEGAGAVVLSSPHIEYGAPRTRSPFEPKGISTLFDTLSANESFRSLLMNKVVNFLFDKFDDDCLSPFVDE